ncbi:MAG: NapC/NirT family cytochrome c [bacterium]|nr:MAG: NapC/NirT family cytochrome c [bacterium]
MKPLEVLGKLLDLMRKLRFYEVILLLCITGVVGAWSLIEITESAVFCGNTCHIMRSYYEDWKTSTHNKVACVECHNPEQGEKGISPKFRALAQVASYFTRTYGDHTRAEVSDAGCLKDGCHSKRLLEGRAAFQGDIFFDHGPHLQQLRRGKILRCISCHSQVAMGNHITVVADTCFICHFKNLETNTETSRCTLCHANPGGEGAVAGGTGFDHSVYMDRGVICTKCHQDVIRGEGRVDENRCPNCHGRRLEMDLSEPVEVLHREHVTDHSVGCTQCHDPILHSALEEIQPSHLDCSSCHEDRHNGIVFMYQGKGAFGVQSLPSPMFQARVGCRGCHIIPADVPNENTIYRGQTMKAITEACDACHGPGFAPLVKEWKASLRKALDAATVTLRDVETAVGASTGRTRAVHEARRLVRDARHNIIFVRASQPVHNPEYALAILRGATEDLKRARSLVSQ